MLDQNVIWLKQTDKDDFLNVGMHGVKLGELSREGIPIPDGFIVTTHSFNNFIRENNLTLKAKHLISTANFNDPNSLRQVSDLIKKYFVAGNLSNDFKLDIYNAYKKLSKNLVDKKVKVTHSKSSDKNIVNKHTNHNEIKGESSLIHAILDIWSSNFSEINIIKNNDLKKSANSILVQEVIVPELSGKIYTIDPISKSKNKIIIKAAHGQFDDKLNLIKYPDHYEIDKNSHILLSKQISSFNKKPKKLFEFTKKARTAQKLFEHEIEELVKLAKITEKIHYFPQEIDWSFEKGKFYFINVKPLTI